MDFLHRTWAEIDMSALVHNYNIIKKLSNGVKLMAVVKANAYGHSVNHIAPVLQKIGADSFAVSNIDEALQLRELGIVKPILILGYTPVELVTKLNKYNITQCVYSSEYSKLLSENAVKHNVKIDIHIKLDTGMSRLGFDCRNEDIAGIHDAIAAAKLKNLNLTGIFTHFSSSDRSTNSEDGFTDHQYKIFINAITHFKKEGISPEICHCCNSAAIIKDPEKTLQTCRPGIILYGLSPSTYEEFDCNLTPVMTLKSVVSMIKEISAGDFISYGKTFKAKKNMTVATVAAGYADGYPRALSNKAYVLINGKKAKILGRVCMDQMTVDVTNIPEAKMGDEVILFGKDLSVDILAKHCNTINYEIVCGISPRVPRIIKDI